MATVPEKIKATARSGYAVEDLLGIKYANNLKLAEKVKAGFCFDALERLGKTTGLPLERLRVAVRISPRTLTRRRKEKNFLPKNLTVSFPSRVC